MTKTRGDFVKPKLAVVETIYESNARDICAMLRKLADEIEADELTDPTSALTVVQVMSDGECSLYVFGETGLYHVIGMLERGKHAAMQILEAGK